MILLQIDWNPNPELFSIGKFAIRYYSLMFVLAFVLGLYLMKKIYINEKVSLEKLDSLFIYVVVATLIGARIGHFLFYEPETLFNDPLKVILPFEFSPKFKFTGYAGLASHGAAIGIITALYFYSKKVLKKHFLWILDRAVIVIALGGAFVRLGNLMNSEIIGKRTNSDYGFVFRRLDEDFARHPTQIYESLGYLIIFFVLWYLYWKTNVKEKLGFIFGLLLVLLWSMRFFVEYFKEAQVDGREDWIYGLNTGQVLSIPFIIVGLYLVFRKTRVKAE